MSAVDVIRWVWDGVQLVLGASSILYAVRLCVNWRGSADALSRDGGLFEPLRERWGLDVTWWRLFGLAGVGLGLVGVGSGLCSLSVSGGSAAKVLGFAVYVVGMVGTALRSATAVRAHRHRSGQRA